jgi:hypothetical protein
MDFLIEGMKLDISQSALWITMVVLIITAVNLVIWGTRPKKKKERVPRVSDEILLAIMRGSKTTGTFQLAIKSACNLNILRSRYKLLQRVNRIKDETDRAWARKKVNDFYPLKKR